MPLDLNIRASAAARVQEAEDVWRLSLGDDTSAYQLAQLDDYSSLARGKFRHRPPFSLSLRARASHTDLPGTWGFGLWNDPFGFSLGLRGRAARLPALPNAAWFFFASAENHLSLSNELPGNGALAAVFSSPRIPSLLLAPAVLAMPLLALPATARSLRVAARALIKQDAVELDIDPTQWHSYELTWNADLVEFKVDGVSVLHTSLSPRPPLGLVLWLDNQYAAWPPSGRLSSGTLPPQQGSWVELSELRVH